MSCTSASTDTRTTTCNGLQVDGLNVRFTGNEATAICNAIGGNWALVDNGGSASTPYMTYGTSWSVVTPPASYIPIAQLVCNI